MCVLAWGRKAAILSGRAKIQKTIHLETILKYFPDLSGMQQQQLHALQQIYTDWNAKINVISRKDMDAFYLHHVLHSLSLMKIVRFKPGTQILDVGTGGGFPGIPLAICFPECHFLLVDSIGKKIGVVQDVATQLQLQHVSARQTRAEDISERFDFVVSRAVTRLPVFWQWVSGKFLPGGFNDIPNGILYLKGGDFDDELQQLQAVRRIYDLGAIFDEPYFSTKKLVHIYNRSPKRISIRGNNA